MGVRRIEDFFAFQAAVEFKEEAHRLVRASPEAHRDLKFRSQLWDAVDAIDADMAEGFRRGNPSEFANFLRYALASHAEATRRLQSGISRGYFSADGCARALTWAVRCNSATKGLLASQYREIARRKAEDAKRKRSGRAGGRASK